MTVLLARILELERAVDRWRNKYHDARRQRDLWKARYNRIARKGL